MNYSDGWQRAIDIVNARIPNGVSSEPDETPPTEIPAESGGVDPGQRAAIILNVCSSLGMPELAVSFADDSRALPEIMRGIYAAKMQLQTSKMVRGCFGNWVER